MESGSQELTVQEVRRTLSKDYFHSFSLAQGDPGATAKFLFQGLREEYVGQWGSGATKLLLEVHQDMQKQIVNIRVPSGHGVLINDDEPDFPITPQGISAEFDRMWNTFGNELRASEPASPHKLGMAIIRRDVIFCNRPEGRTSKMARTDPFKSYYRQHVLCRERMTPTIDNVLANVREAAEELHHLANRTIGNKPLSLIDAWESKHDEHFYPSDLSHLH